MKIAALKSAITTRLAAFGTFLCLFPLIGMLLICAAIIAWYEIRNSTKAAPQPVSAPRASRPQGNRLFFLTISIANSFRMGCECSSQSDFFSSWQRYTASS